MLSATFFELTTLRLRIAQFSAWHHELLLSQLPRHVARGGARDVDPCLPKRLNRVRTSEGPQLLNGFYTAPLRALEKSAQETRMKTTSHAVTRQHMQLQVGPPASHCNRAKPRA